MIIPLIYLTVINSSDMVSLTIKLKHLKYKKKFFCENSCRTINYYVSLYYRIHRYRNY